MAASAEHGHHTERHWLSFKEGAEAAEAPAC